MAESLKVGDCVEVFGLESESGKELNAQRGILTDKISAKDRWQVRLAPEKVVSLKPENLKKVELTVAERLRVLGLGGSGQGNVDGVEKTKQSRSRSREPKKYQPPKSQDVQGKDDAEYSDLPFKPGHCVEVFGMESEKGKRLNGLTGIVVRYLKETQRFEVRFIPDYIVSLKADNLRKMEFKFNTPASEESGKGDEEAKPKSRSSSSSSSGRSRSRSRSKATLEKGNTLPFQIGDYVVIFGLESEGGKVLNGQTGPIVAHLQEKERFEVQVGPKKTVNVKPANLRRSARPSESDAKEAPEVKPKPEAPAQEEKNEQVKEQSKSEPTSLASLLGLGRTEPAPEEKKPEQWESVWSRSGGGSVVSVKLSQDEIDTFNALQNTEDKGEDEIKALRRQVEDEFRAAGAFDEGMVEEIFQERLKEFRMMKALRPEGSPAVPKTSRRSQSRSSSSSSSSSSSKSNEDAAKE